MTLGYYNISTESGPNKSRILVILEIMRLGELHLFSIYGGLLSSDIIKYWKSLHREVDVGLQMLEPPDGSQLRCIMNIQHSRSREVDLRVVVNAAPPIQESI